MTSILKALGIYKPSLPFSQGPVEIQDIETAAEKRPRTLKHLIKANHANFGVLQDDGTPNRLSYNLGSAYFLGASWEQLNDIYESEELKFNDSHDQWKDSPSEVTLEDWNYLLGKPEYQRAYVDFFEDQLVTFAYDWKALVHYYLHKDETPLICNIIGYNGDPLIQLAFALEVSSRTLAIESLARACCEYNPVFLQCCNHKGDSASEAGKKENLKTILEAVSKDKELSTQRHQSIDEVLDNHASRLTAHIRSWNIDGTSLESEFVNAQLQAMAFDTESAHGQTLFADIIKSAYALRILLPLQPDAESQVCLLRQWLLLFLSTYVFAGMPKVNKSIKDVELSKVVQWKNIQNHAVDKHSDSINGIGVGRALKALSETWPIYEGHYLQAASYYTGTSKHGK